MTSANRTATSRPRRLNRCLKKSHTLRPLDRACGAPSLQLVADNYRRMRTAHTDHVSTNICNQASISFMVRSADCVPISGSRLKRQRPWRPGETTQLRCHPIGSDKAGCVRPKHAFHENFGAHARNPRPPKTSTQINPRLDAPAVRFSVRFMRTACGRWLSAPYPRFDPSKPQACRLTPPSRFPVSTRLEFIPGGHLTGQQSGGRTSSDLHLLLSRGED